MNEFEKVVIDKLESIEYRLDLLEKEINYINRATFESEYDNQIEYR